MAHYSTSFYDSPPITPPETTSSSPLYIHRPVPVVFNEVDFWKHHSLTTDTKPKSRYRKRVNSDLTNHAFQQTKNNRRSRSNSTPMIQTRVPWTPEEDDLLQKGYEQGLSWAMISCNFLPHRSRGCCWGRFKTLQNKNAIEVYQQRICQRPWRINRPHQTKK
ncbi:hypothetical protein A0J61_02958 [Choanephora cucurbitarum]|uniref:Myb-like domain-containing protein n=1 Tax=Choanephora cucurbitarum TaxID=101091 RepID=A0A1C7NJ24_9FUNG|nr:hypothetical protein A0J61_02958 [Choanephora cucurbitarum]